MALDDWLPRVNNHIRSWTSTTGISPGDRWMTKIGVELDSTDVGILCVTNESLDSPWLNFEAGALAKKLSDSRVIPILAGVRRSQVKDPLGQFNSVLLDKDGMTSLVMTLNQMLPSDQRLKEVHQQDAIMLYWARFEQDIQPALDAKGSTLNQNRLARSPEDIMDELLELTRSLHRRRKTLIGDSEEWFTEEEITHLAYAWRAFHAIRSGRHNGRATWDRAFDLLNPVIDRILSNWYPSHIMDDWMNQDPVIPEEIKPLVDWEKEAAEDLWADMMVDQMRGNGE